ncbi:MAG TPA: LytTR family DNA-binding domain-containing protein [Candidatus Limnocylindria bacterium]|jgi:DNA-binding LytR/AlgR family response regulator
MTAGLRVLVVDDEPAARAELQHLLGRIAGVGPPDLCETAGEAIDAIGRRSYDVVFLDIRMPGMSGLEVLPIIHERSPDLAVVFVTAFDEHALQAFELAAADYLLKPISELRLRRSLDRVSERRRAAAPVAAANDRIPVEGTTGTLLLRLADVRHLHVRGHAVFAKTFDTEHRARSTLSELEERLAPQGFQRVHRSFLVNVEHVAEVEPFFNGALLLRMDDRERSEIPVGRAAAPRLRALFGL